MKLMLIKEALEQVEITEAAVTKWFDVGAEGCDSLAVQMTASEADTPEEATIQLQASLDKTAVTLVGSPVSVAGNGVFSVEKDRPAFQYYRVAYAITSGSYISNLKILCKGDKE